MPKKREILIYTFGELSPEAKQKAIDDYRHKGWAFDEFHAENLTEWFSEDLKSEWGIEADPKKIYWQLSYVQGDHLVFSGDVDLDVFLKKVGEFDKYKPLKDGKDWMAQARVTESSRGFGSGTMSGEAELTDYEYDEESPEEYDKLEALTVELEETVKEGAREAASELMSAGYKEIEYQSSDEVISESIEANELEFDENGKMI